MPVGQLFTEILNEVDAVVLPMPVNSLRWCVPRSTVTSGVVHASCLNTGNQRPY